MKQALSVAKGIMDGIIIVFILGFLGGAQFNHLNINIISFGWVYAVITILNACYDEDETKKKE